ncbi:hypothetical protein DdX_16130 [Ditylenchus destructor]|uniref:Uncharacterized protein n=1 Tax=Ditylenchus destructor TaxID=166010 RepID=A0AAD4MP34_9BILA|nr:hypothetical protein DdX_16130 [Ditylenchus destructor]
MNRSTQDIIQPIAPRPYLSSLIFAETIVTLAFQFISIFVMARLLIQRYTTPAKLQFRDMSKTVIIYMVVHMIGSVVTLPHHFYLVLLWKPAAPIIAIDDPLYNPYILYWTGLFMIAYFYTPAVPVFFLTLERCVALKCPIQYHNRSIWFINKLPSIATIASVVWCVIIVVASFPDSPMDMSKVKYCQSYVCVAAGYEGKFRILRNYMKNSISIANVLCTAYLLCALRMYKTYTTDGKHFAMKNRVVIVTSLSEVLLNVLPMLFGSLFLNFTGQSVGNILGNHMLLLFTLDAVICSLYYIKIYLKKGPQSTEVTPNSKGKAIFTKHTPPAPMINDGNVEVSNAVICSYK